MTFVFSELLKVPVAKNILTAERSNQDVVFLQMPRALLRCLSGKGRFFIIYAASYTPLRGTGLTVCVSVHACVQQEQSQH